MSKGNINYKYLRRRKNWFQRNWKPLLAWIILIGVIVAAVSFAVIKINNAGGFGNLFGKKDNSSDIVQETQTQNEEKETKEVVWVEDKEPESKEVNYKVPDDVEFPYYIMVNRAANCVTVYGIDDDGKYSIPVKAFAASCGREGEETITGDGYTTTDKYVWRLMVDGTYGHYAFRIDGGYLFHSVPYLTASNDSLETEEYNKLGSFASLGCVRMCVRDVYWLYDNCPAGTKVDIYDNASNPGPLGKPDSIKIPVDSKYANWDPTDPDENNPWKDYSAEIKGAKDITTKVGEKVDLLKNVTATDTCGNDISDDIITVGNYTFDKAGEYDIKYEVTDAIGSKAVEKIVLKVTE